MRIQWTEKEKRLLLSVAEEMDYRWRAIRQKYFVNRTDDSVRNLYSRITCTAPMRTFGKQVKERITWTKEEDTLIRHFVEKNGCKWSIISPLLPRRTTKAIRGRWDRLQTLMCQLKENNLDTELMFFYNTMKVRSGKHPN